MREAARECSGVVGMGIACRRFVAISVYPISSRLALGALPGRGNGFGVARGDYG